MVRVHACQPVRSEARKMWLPSYQPAHAAIVFIGKGHRLMAKVPTDHRLAKAPIREMGVRFSLAFPNTDEVMAISRIEPRPFVFSAVLACGPAREFVPL